MGKRSRLEMTGLSEEKRVKQSLKRKAEEKERLRKAYMQVTKALVEQLTSPVVVPSIPDWRPPKPIFNPLISELLGLERAKKKQRVLKQKRKK